MTTRLFSATVLATLGLTATAAASTTLRFSAHPISQHQSRHTFRIRERLTDLATGKVVGHDSVVCHGATCSGKLTLRTGTLTFKGDSDKPPVRITKATGAYAGRTGTIDVKDTKGDPIITIVLR